MPPHYLESDERSGRESARGGPYDDRVAAGCPVFSEIGDESARRFGEIRLTHYVDSHDRLAVPLSRAERAGYYTLLRAASARPERNPASTARRER